MTIMAKNIRFEQEEVGLEDLLKGITGLRKDVRQIKTSLVSQTKPAYTNKEVMEMFGIASATLKKWRDAGLLGYSQVGSVYLYSKDDIDKFLKSNHYDTFASDKGFIRSVRKLGM